MLGLYMQLKSIVMDANCETVTNIQRLSLVSMHTSQKLRKQDKKMGFEEVYAIIPFSGLAIKNGKGAD